MHPRLAAVWWAPPCGTASRARERPIRGKAGPPPLRSDDFPDRLPNLSGLHQLRVTAANELYGFLASCVLATAKHNIIHVVENPRSSLFWRTSMWKRVSSNTLPSQLVLMGVDAPSILRSRTHMLPSPGSAKVALARLVQQTIFLGAALKRASLPVKKLSTQCPWPLPLLKHSAWLYSPSSATTWTMRPAARQLVCSLKSASFVPWSLSSPSH